MGLGLECTAPPQLCDVRRGGERGRQRRDEAKVVGSQGKQAELVAGEAGVGDEERQRRHGAAVHRLVRVRVRVRVRFGVRLRVRKRVRGRGRGRGRGSACHASCSVLLTRRLARRAPG